MKIIGKTAEGYILESSADELAEFIGFYSHWQMEKGTRLEVGMEIQVHKMYKQLNALAGNQKALASMAAQIRNVADLLEVHDPVISAVAEEAKGRQ